MHDGVNSELSRLSSEAERKVKIAQWRIEVLWNVSVLDYGGGEFRSEQGQKASLHGHGRSTLTSWILSCRGPEIHLCHGISEVPITPGRGNGHFVLFVLC